MTLSRIWGADAAHDVASVSMAGVKQVTSSGFRSLYAPPAGLTAATAARSAPAFEPEVDPVDQARMEAFAQGFDEGCRVTGDAMANETEARTRLAEALEILAPAPSGMLSTMLSATVVRLVEQIVGEVEIDIERLLQRCDTVAAFIDEDDKKGALHLHPDDITLVEGENIAVRLVADKTLKRGCVRLETADGWVEDGPDVRLSRLRALLDDMEGKA